LELISTNTFFSSKAERIDSKIVAITDNTSESIRLNSSKQIQHPVVTYPMNNFSSILISFDSEQLNTIQNFPKILARSLILSVFPVPAGPAGLAPNLFYRAVIMVMWHFSVRGVTTRRVIAPTMIRYITEFVAILHWNVHYL
jgi:hypothetical protein